jgi:DNA repair photolyase
MKIIEPKFAHNVNPTSYPKSELDNATLAKLLSSFKTPDGKPKYGMSNGKPVIFIDVKNVLSDESAKFHDKLLCDGLTMNAGDACVFSCAFCYVPAAMIKLHAARLAEFNHETGLNFDLSQVVIRRRNFLEVLKKQLRHEDGSRIYGDPNDQRVLYSSTLVDVAGNMELLRETAAACILIFENTAWQIRLLSKSSLLAQLVTKNLIPKQYHHRLILGFSTGALDDDLAEAIESGTGKVSMRIKALHELQDLGIRTFGMICPSLPYGRQEDYDEFSRAMCQALWVDRCEHVWAEVINLRGQSLEKTVKALHDAKFYAEEELLKGVSGPGSRTAWEEYARMTFEAHQKHIPANKMRFLQYVKNDTADCWSCMRKQGAVLLGKAAEEKGLITISTSALTVPFPDLSDDDILYREEREKIVTDLVRQSLSAAKALHEIKTYRDGILWRKDYRTFADYCEQQWGYQKSQAYRHVQAGAFLARLDQSNSPIGEKSGITETHLRPVLENVPEELQVECWESVSKSVPPNRKLTASHVKRQATQFLKNAGIQSKKKATETKPRKPGETGLANTLIERSALEIGEVLPNEQIASGLQSPTNIEKPIIPEALEMLVNARREEDWSAVDSVIELLTHAMIQP